MEQIQPHGGKLINRELKGRARDELLVKTPFMERIHLDARAVSDLEMIAVGAFSPLQGFMTRADYESVRDHKELAEGLPWTIPVTLPVGALDGCCYREGDDIALYDQNDSLLGVLHLEEKYQYDKDLEARLVYGTTELAHPGVRTLHRQGDWLLGGPISLLNRSKKLAFLERRLDPAGTRAEFERRGWKRVVAFQTRNPIHRAHEYIQKCALEIVDGLLIHPLVGETKSDDIPADVRMECYRTLIDQYYNRDRTMLTVMPLAMRYAGPREAVLHSLIRKNYGVTHFIVGRDHAGVGNYYGTYDAQKIFDQFKPDEIGVTPLKFEHSTWCKVCEGMVSSKTCPHGQETKVFLSGTKVRDMLKAGQRPPMEFSRPEVADILIRWAQRAG